MKNVLSFFLVLTLLIGLLPVYSLAAETPVNGFAGKTLSILGDSISTFTGVSNDATVNSTLKGGAIYYNSGTLGVYRNDTWWQQAVDRLGMTLLVDNAWSGSCVLKERSGTVGAYIDRCVQLHNAAGEEPDIIAVYLGTNDFWSFPGTLGTADDIAYDSLINQGNDGFVYAEPATTCEAYAIMLHKMVHRYPDAEIYCFTLLPRSNQSAAKVQALEAFNSCITSIADHFGASVVDLYHDSGIKADENFQFYVADNSLHPGPAGMDAITGCFTSGLLNNSRYTDGSVYEIAYQLDNVIPEQGTQTAVLGGSSFTCRFTVPMDHILNITVTMDGNDITDRCCTDNTVTIDNVTGNIRITASAELAPKVPENYLWECKDDQLVSVSGFGNTENILTMTQGSITDGKFANVKYTMAKAVTLKHDQPWVLEWTSEGSWSDTTDGALLFAGSATSSTPQTPYLYRRYNSDFIAFGYSSGGKYYNYGVALGANGIDGTAHHTYRLANRIFEDGSNMVYLYVDNEEIAPMNHHWVGGTDQKKTVDWINGQDFVFTHMGTSPHTIGNCYIDYIQVSEGGHVHSYDLSVTAPTCSTQGYSTYTCSCGDIYVTDHVAATGEHCYENAVCSLCGKTDPAALQAFRWECKDDQLVSVLTSDNSENPLTMTQGSITDGQFTNVCYTLNEAIVLKHDSPWIMEWVSEGSWSDTTDGALLFAGSATSSTPQTPYLYRRHNSDFIAFGYSSGGRYYNYGVALGANGIDGTLRHTYRLENRLFEDGSNMVYLYVDGVEISPMNHHWIGGTDQKQTVDWVNGQDLVFTHMGTSPHTIGNCYIDYIQIWEMGHTHNHTASATAPTCAEQGYTTYVCACGDRYVADYVPATGEHRYENTVCVLCGQLDPDVPQNFRWECEDDRLVSVLTSKNSENLLTMTQGSITDGKFTNVRYTLNEAVVLRHDRPWIMEWVSEGSWSDTTDGALLFAGSATSSTPQTPYLYRRHNSDFIAFGYSSGGRYYNYGVALGANGIDGTLRHTYRLENRLFQDGSNMVYLYVDNEEIAPMNHYWVGGTDQKQTVDWINGQDLVFTHMGTSPHTIGNCYIDYIQIWENGHEHQYELTITAPTCVEQGYTTYACICGEGYTADYTDATGKHSYQDSTCIDCGKKQPVLTLKAPTLEFKDMICIVAFFTAENTEDVVEMGMLTYKNQVTEWNVDNADFVIPGAGYEASTDRYYAGSQGIHAKYLSETLYLACYAKLTDGSYVYTKLAPYSPITYATNQLNNSTDTKLKQLVVSMLNYGTAAQIYFGYHVENLANAGVTPEQQALPESYRSDMVQAVPGVSTAKQGSFVNNSGFRKRSPAVSFEGAFSINYFFTPGYTPVGDIQLYYWNEADFNSAQILTPENASGFVTMINDGTGQYRGDIEKISAKNLSQGVYVAAVYSDGTNTWTSGVLGYSIGAYCASQAAKGGTMADLAMATAVYGHHAKAYFG